MIHATIILVPGEASTLRDFLKSLRVLLPILKLSTVGLFCVVVFFNHGNTTLRLSGLAQIFESTLLF